MRRQTCSRARNFKRLEGFALAEIIVALFLVTMAVMLVGGLSQQVMNLSKSSKQTSAMIELRSKINSLTRNSDDWIHKMRVDPTVGSIYSGCIPDASVVSTSFPPANEENWPMDCKGKVSCKNKGRGTYSKERMGKWRSRGAMRAMLGAAPKAHCCTKWFKKT